MEKIVEIEGAGIRDRESFHTYFAQLMGFPSFYGRNMDAWIDCMTYVDDPDAGMTKVNLSPGELLVLQIKGAKDLKNRCREVYDALVECSAFVNYRRIESGERPLLFLSFCG